MRRRSVVSSRRRSSVHPTVRPASRGRGRGATTTPPGFEATSCGWDRSRSGAGVEALPVDGAEQVDLTVDDGLAVGGRCRAADAAGVGVHTGEDGGGKCRWHVMETGDRSFHDGPALLFARRRRQGDGCGPASPPAPAPPRGPMRCVVVADGADDWSDVGWFMYGEAGITAMRGMETPRHRSSCSPTEVLGHVSRHPSRGMFGLACRPPPTSLRALAATLVGCDDRPAAALRRHPHRSSVSVWTCGRRAVCNGDANRESRRSTAAPRRLPRRLRRLGPLASTREGWATFG
jgi:hypothetical protein